MKYQRGLQVKLQERYRRLYKSDENSYLTEIRYFHNFLLSIPVIKAILTTLVEGEKDFDGDAWFSANFSYKNYSWPRSEGAKLKLVWELVEQWAAIEGDTKEDRYGAQGPIRIAMNHFASGNGQLEGCLRTMTEDAVEPLVEYLQRCLIDDNDILYLLERHKRLVEWFEADRLYKEFLADPAHGEKVYDENLRRFLFSEGVDYPFSQPASASGRADVVADVDKDDALVCEVKLLVTSLRHTLRGQGPRPGDRYAHDWGKTVAYLAIFNVSDRALELPTDGEQGEWPPRVHVEGVVVYLVLIQAKPLVSASAAGRPKPRIVGREELIRSLSDLTAPRTEGQVGPGA